MMTKSGDREPRANNTLHQLRARLSKKDVPDDYVGKMVNPGKGQVSD